MKEELAQRLASLQGEFEKGHERLRELRQQEAQLQQTLFRIEGAMSVLSEFLKADPGEIPSAG